MKALAYYLSSITKEKPSMFLYTAKKSKLLPFNFKIHVLHVFLLSVCYQYRSHVL